MEQELWRKVEEVFHAALERTPDARKSFLDGFAVNHLRRQVQLARSSGTELHTHRCARLGLPGRLADNHPIHYDVEYARRHGHTTPVVHGLQVLRSRLPGQRSFLSTSERVHRVYRGVLQISQGNTCRRHALFCSRDCCSHPQGDSGQVTTRATIHNQRVNSCSPGNTISSRDAPDELLYDGELVTCSDSFGSLFDHGRDCFWTFKHREMQVGRVVADAPNFLAFVCFMAGERLGR